jgi:hypothetical protein
MTTFGAISGGLGRARRFWELSFPPPTVLGEAALIAAIAIAVIESGWRLGMKRKRTRKRRVDGSGWPRVNPQASANG